MNKQKKSYLPLWRCLLPAGWYTVIFRFSAPNATVSGSLSDRLLYRLLHAVSGAFRALTAEGQTAVVEFLSYYERKGAHMFLYFVLMGLLLFALRPWLTSAPKRAAAAIAVCTVLAALDEFHQTFVPGRSGQPSDVLVDLSGAACFLLVWFVVRCVWRVYAFPESTFRKGPE